MVVQVVAWWCTGHQLTVRCLQDVFLSTVKVEDQHVLSRWRMHHVPQHFHQHPNRSKVIRRARTPKSCVIMRTQQDSCCRSWWCCWGCCWCYSHQNVGDVSVRRPHSVQEIKCKRPGRPLHRKLHGDMAQRSGLGGNRIDLIGPG